MGKVLAKAASISRRKSLKSNSSSSSNNSQTTLTSNPTPSLTSTLPEHSSIRQDPRKSSSNLLDGPEDDDKLIKSLLKQYKKLEVDLTKFNSKNNGITKTNILRMTILPFLRNKHRIEEKFPKSSEIYKSLVSFIISVLLKWWNSLLISLSPSKTIISSTDRNAYLECISRIVSRDEWLNVDKDLFQQYENFLTLTLDYCIHKLQTLKIIPLSIAAFIGKIFAYSFFHLPKVSNALLFLLNVKQSMLDSLLEKFNFNKIPAEHLNYLYDQFPSHLHFLINFKGTKSLSRRNKFFINSIPPPQHPVKGIKDPNGLWVRRWCNCDSDVFNSFFRHYITIIQRYLNNSIIEEIILLNCPGFTIILSHIFQIFQISVDRISKNSINKPNNESPNASILLHQNNHQQSQKLNNGNSGSNKININQNDIYYNSIIKIFKTLRDINYSPTIFFNQQLIKFIDKLFIIIAEETSVYDYTKNGLILNIIYEFINHVNSNINWEFWLSCSYMMIQNTDHIQILLKNFAFLFNTWDMIPQSLTILSDDKIYLQWLINKNQSFKLNFINWLTSNEIFERFLIHWHPIVRSYYLRLLIWRVIGINNYESSISIQITKKIENKLIKSFERLCEFDKQFKLNYMPDNPLVNRKFGILPLNLKDDYLLIDDDQEIASSISTTMKSSELRKTHSFEIFDEAIYTCSSLPSSPNDESNKPSSRNLSLANSIGKLFKILSIDDNRHDVNCEGLSLGNKRNSVSLTSLSTAYSTKSRSSSPSIMSFNSTPTSLTDFSTNSSIISDSDSFSSNSEVLVTQPPEIFKTPPEIVRPVYKFEIVIDNESMNKKFLIINNKTFIDKEKYKLQRFFPERPKIASISIFINNDPYDKLFINIEDILLMNDFEELIDRDDEEIFKDLCPKHNSIKWLNLGKSLIELNSIIEEFKNYLIKRIEVDKFNNAINTFETFNDFNYFKKIIPFLSVDSSNDFKLLNAG